jgi:hypothetical protein
LRRRGIVEPDQRLAIDALGEDGEVAAYRLHVEGREARGIGPWNRRRLVEEVVAAVAGRWQRRSHRQRAFAGEFIEHAAQGDLARQFEGMGNDVIVSDWCRCPVGRRQRRCFAEEVVRRSRDTRGGADRCGQRQGSSVGFGHPELRSNWPRSDRQLAERWRSDRLQDRRRLADRQAADPWCR